MIIDELGRGTSTTEGFKIAWSIAKYILQDIGCFALFATHFHEMTLLQEQVKTIENYSMSVITQGGNLKMLYKVRKEASSRSYGIFIAEMLKFP